MNWYPIQNAIRETWDFIKYNGFLFLGIAAFLIGCYYLSGFIFHNSAQVGQNIFSNVFGKK